jgi:uncharacterized membrane protein
MPTRSADRVDGASSRWDSLGFMAPHEADEPSVEGESAQPKDARELARENAVTGWFANTGPDPAGGWDTTNSWAKTANYWNNVADKVRRSDPHDVQEIVADQIKLLAGIYADVAQQAARSFRLAVSFAVVGIAFFTFAVVWIVVRDASSAALIGGIAGAVVEVWSGVAFYLYSRATTQLSEFHRRLDQTQRFMLANSICEELEEPERSATRSRLVQAIAGFAPAET